MKRTLSVILVLLQILFIAYLLVDIKIRTSSPGIILIIIACFLGVWAIISIRKSKFSIMPQPAEGSTLIKKGPYSVIRHPMYTSVILFAIGAVHMQYTLYRLMAAVLLIVVLIIKLNYEEKLLLKKFPEYKNYMNSSWRLVPYIY